MAKCGPKPVDPEVRFERHTCYVGDCIVWTGALDKDGYGQFSGFPGGKAHRYAYVKQYGPIPSGMVVNHLCRNHACVNAAHMEAVTHIENVLHHASQAVTRINASKVQCIRGHALTTYLRTNGRPRRYCKTCQAQNESKRRVRKRPKYAVWTQGEIDELFSGLPVREIALKIGRTVHAVYFRRSKETIARRKQVSA